MKKVIAMFALATVFVACDKEECAECHYDTANGEVEIGQYCDDDLEAIEADGYVINGETKEVHCGEH